MQIAEIKTAHPADASPRWIVAGPSGQVIYDVLGNHLALLYPDGDIDAMAKEYADRARYLAERFDDKAMFQLLSDHYRNVLSERSPDR